MSIRGEEEEGRCRDGMEEVGGYDGWLRNVDINETRLVFYMSC